MIYMKRKSLVKPLVFIFVALFSCMGCHAQINTDRVLSIGRNALYFEDYVLSIQYFNQVIKVKPYLPEPYFYRGVAKISLEDYSGAEEDCSLALERNPFLTEAYRCRGVARVYLKKIEEARADFEKGLEFSPNNKTLLLCKGYASMQNEDYQRAVADFTTAIEAFPRFKEAFLNRGYAYFQMDDTLKALADFEKVLEFDAFSADGLSARGLVRYRQGLYKESLEDYDKAIRVEPYRANYYLNRGLVRYQLMNLRGAMSDYDHVIKLDPYNVLAYYNRGVLRNEIGDKNRAVEDFDRVLEYEPDNYFALYNRAIIQNELGEYGKAIKDYDEIIRAYPNFPPAYYGRGEAKLKLRNEKGAQKDFNTAMFLNHKNINSQVKDTTENTRKKSNKNLSNYKKLVVADKEEQARRLTYRNESRGKVQNVNFHIESEKNFTLTYYPQKRVDVQRPFYFNEKIEKWNNSKKLTKTIYLTNAISHENIQLDQVFEQIAKVSKKIEASPSAELLFERSMLYAVMSDFDGSIEELDKAIGISSQEYKPFYYFMRANVRVDKMEYEFSLKDEVDKKEMLNTLNYHSNKIVMDVIMKDYEKAIELYPEFPFAWFNRGNILYLQQDYRTAIANYTKSIEKESDFAEAYFNRGLCYIKIGENEKGIEDLSKAGELGIYIAYNVIKRFRE